ncbi:hypothetical protein FIU87_13360 [Bacillus sp. THAF10]|uniref:hypothetical protein n=1 Tax=Bacillus sp. THAF10 TaxID=2587848 RepID=UPI0012AA3C6B|nr:hypothetical protein [Bacillus sp. THAF10]QFT89643.1 hypothetical protein FIU87_13360 [Bacillus sp. THAF10]
MFIFICIVAVIASVLLFQKLSVKNPFSKGVGMAIALSILGVVSLAQNYTQSLIPEANDGMGISNTMAYWIIGDVRWTHDMFKSMYEQSIYLSLILIAAYPIVLVLESKFRRKVI